MAKPSCNNWEAMLAKTKTVLSCSNSNTIREPKFAIYPHTDSPISIRDVLSTGYNVFAMDRTHLLNMPRLQTKPRTNYIGKMPCSPGTAIHISEFTRQLPEPTQQIDRLPSLRPHVSPPSRMRSPDPRFQPLETYQAPWPQLNANSYHQGQSSSSNRQVNKQGSSAPYQSSRENLNRGYQPAKIGSSKECANSKIVSGMNSESRDPWRESPPRKIGILIGWQKGKNWRPTFGKN
ncbi:hypothetical protein BCON_1151g00010 [Botryotinia convoluta]|uniref:Uncharacterized protein n=1 Tax=Botryotinia convoluta TaxID=54673 RepID=A0A4Z1H6J1_9HELO|nr:hypothetical protein BCON_1151g00010 [Botryotinia convoluta]